MEIRIPQGVPISVDRSGTAEPGRDMRQGFNVWLCGQLMHFEDEADAERLARDILRRQGVDV